MEFSLVLHKNNPFVIGRALVNDPIKYSHHSIVGLQGERVIPLSIGSFWMVLKDNLMGEVRFSCSKVTKVATISNLVVSNASVARSYIPARVHTRWGYPRGWYSSGKGGTH